jgi:hypothetical protein
MRPAPVEHGEVGDSAWEPPASAARAVASTTPVVGDEHTTDPFSPAYSGSASGGAVDADTNSAVDTGVAEETAGPRPAADDHDGAKAPRWDQHASDDPPSRAPRSRRTTAIAVLAVVALAVAALFVAQFLRDRDETVASNDGSIPRSVEQLWEWDGGDGQADSEMIVAGETVVVSVSARGVFDRLVGLDVRTGDVRWERDDIDVSGGLQLVDGDEDVAVVQGGFDDSRVLGLAPLTGETLWERSEQQSFAFVPPGSDVIVETSFDGETGIAVVDPATGEDRARLDGVLVTTNFEGSWLLVDESSDELLVADFEADDIVPTRLAPAGDTTLSIASRTAMIGDRVLVIDDGDWVELLGDDERSSITVVDRRPDDERMVDVTFAESDSLGGIGVGGERGVIVEQEIGLVIGVHLDGDELILDWSRSIQFVNLHLTDRGILIEGADEIDFDWQGSDDATAPAAETNRSYLIDGASGENVVVWERATVFDSTRAASNGVVVLEPGDAGFESDLVGYLADGESLWRIEGDVDAAVVGDDVVIAHGRFDVDHTVVRGYGP